MRRLLLLSLVLAATTFAAYPNLQLAYRFQNSALDWSGNGRNGTVNGSGVYTTARGQQCLYFDGTGDYITTPSFGLSGTVVVFACNVRCKFNATVIQSFIGDNARAGGAGYLWCYRLSNSNLLAWEWADGTNYWNNSYATFFAAPYNDVWLHMAVVVNYPGKVFYLYRNSILVATVSMTAGGTPLFPSTSRVKYLGQQNTTSFPLTDGYLANVQLWTLATMPPLAVMNASVARMAAGGMPCW
jgi:hypothetical protein